MPCPTCTSSNLWDDNMWWGCYNCGWTNGGNVRNEVSRNDRFTSQHTSEIDNALNRCHFCGGEVPKADLNQIYCSSSCLGEGLRRYRENESR